MMVLWDGINRSSFSAEDLFFALSREAGAGFVFHFAFAFAFAFVVELFAAAYGQLYLDQAVFQI